MGHLPKGRRQGGHLGKVAVILYLPILSTQLSNFSGKTEIPDPKSNADISLTFTFRCNRLAPGVAEATLVKEAVGLRPCRRGGVNNILCYCYCFFVIAIIGEEHHCYCYRRWGCAKDLTLGTEWKLFTTMAMVEVGLRSLGDAQGRWLCHHHHSLLERRRDTHTLHKMPFLMLLLLHTTVVFRWWEL